MTTADNQPFCQTTHYFQNRILSYNDKFKQFQYEKA